MMPISIPTRCRSLIGRFRNGDRDGGIGLRRRPVGRETEVCGVSVGVIFGQADVTGHGAAIGAFRLTLKTKIELADLDELAHEC